MYKTLQITGQTNNFKTAPRCLPSTVFFFVAQVLILVHLWNGRIFLRLCSSKPAPKKFLTSWIKPLWVSSGDLMGRGVIFFRKEFGVISILSEELWIRFVDLQCLRSNKQNPRPKWCQKISKHDFQFSVGFRRKCQEILDWNPKGAPINPTGMISVELTGIRHFFREFRPAIPPSLGLADILFWAVQIFSRHEKHTKNICLISFWQDELGAMVFC